MSEPPCILIVEDEPLIAMMLEDFIASLGHDVAGPCETVAEALATIAEKDFDLAILDVNLKGESVWPVATALRERRFQCLLPVRAHAISTLVDDFKLRCHDLRPLVNRAAMRRPAMTSLYAICSRGTSRERNDYFVTWVEAVKAASMIGDTRSIV